MVLMVPDTGRRYRCLIAESDQFIARLLIRYAEGSDLICVRVQEGEDVLTAARQINPDVIILDAEFPGDKIGWEMMRLLKLGEDTRNISLVSCSWLTQAEVRSLVGNLAAYLQKPNISYSDFEMALQAAGVLHSNTTPQTPEHDLD
jgi:CheY-like chemotaxis protein